MINDDQLDRLLSKVERPARYIGGELNQAEKDVSAELIRFGFAFPDTYEIGMSYLGLQILYKTMNDLKDVYCERLFAPAIDMESEMRNNGIPLFTIETRTPAKDLDFLGFTLQYELSYTNVINMLHLSGIPLYSKERNADHPFVVGGGPCVYNPEPVADFFDFFVIGEAEEVLEKIFMVYSFWKKSNLARIDFLLMIKDIQGVYIPGFYAHVYHEDGTLQSINKIVKEAPDKVEKCFIADLDNAQFPTNPLVPLIEVVHDRSVMELFRGCTRGCRFCQAGMVYRPVRERSQEKIIDLAKEQLKNTGHDELSLLSLATNDYSSIEPLLAELAAIGKEKDVALSLPSLRLDSFSLKILQEIQSYKKTGLTFAPEAGTQRLRNVINKTITDDDIYGAMHQAIELGWNSVKLYFMIGLPTETDEDLAGIVEIGRNIVLLARRIRGGRTGGFQVTLSVSNFVPKAHTPFQWFPQDDKETFDRKHRYLKDACRGLSGIRLNYHDSGQSYIEAVLARGDRRTSRVIVQAWEDGCRFDGWREHFDYGKWVKAFEKTGIDPDYYAIRNVNPDDVLPWDILSCGVTKKYLQTEWRKALSADQTKDCRLGCTGCGITNFGPCGMVVAP